MLVHGESGLRELGPNEVFQSLDGSRVAVVLKSGYVVEVVPQVEGEACLVDFGGARCTRRTGHDGCHVACEPVFVDELETTLMGAKVLSAWRREETW